MNEKELPPSDIGNELQRATRAKDDFSPEFDLLAKVVLEELRTLFAMGVLGREIGATEDPSLIVAAVMIADGIDEAFDFHLKYPERWPLGWSDRDAPAIAAAKTRIRRPG